MTTEQPLTPSLRSQVVALIKTKETNVVNALMKEISAHPTAILERLLRERGFEHTVDKLREEFDDLDHIKDNSDIEEDPLIIELNQKIEDLDDEIRAEKERIRLEIRAKVDALHVEERNRVIEIDHSKEPRLDDLNAKIHDREKEVMNIDHPGLIDRMQEISDLLPALKKVENELTPEVGRRARAIDSSRARLIHLVHDASATAQTKLLQCTTMDEAHKVLENIPTVAEMINIAEDPEKGLMALVERLAPSHTLQLAPPRDEEEPAHDGQVTELKPVEGSISTTHGNVEVHTISIVNQD